MVSGEAVGSSYAPYRGRMSSNDAREVLLPHFIDKLGDFRGSLVKLVYFILGSECLLYFINSGKLFCYYHDFHVKALLIL